MMNARFARWLLFCACALVLAGSPMGQDDDFGKDIVGHYPPELIVPENGWLTMAEHDFTLEKLRGRVVWVEFSFINCGGCIMMKPILQGLQRYHESRGLVVIEINNGAIDTREALLEQAEKNPPNYALLWDKDGATCDAFGVSTYGAAFLIGADGKVIWKGNPLSLSIPDLTWMVTKALNKAEEAEAASGIAGPR